MIITITQGYNKRIHRHYKWLLALLFVVALHKFAHGQLYYNQRPGFLKANSQWAFGNGAGLDFNSSPPLSFQSQCRAGEGTASVADPQTGKLLFYWVTTRTATSLFNANHQQMPDGVMGKNSSTTQGCLIVPMIDSPNKYYVFSLYGPTDEPRYPQPFVGTLFYSVVDMTLDNGLGNVVPGKKNILLDTDTLSESMIAIPGDNCDIWLMVHSYRDPQFKAYHITGAGIDRSPIVSTAGKQIQGGGVNSNVSIRSYHAGGMVVSPDRKKLAITASPSELVNLNAPGIAGLLLCQFDPATGLVSNAIQMEDYYYKDSNRIQVSYSPAFSPDNNKLYAGIYHNNSATHQLRQYTISDYDSTAIAKSKKTIHTFLDKNNNNIIGSVSLKLYKDTIYIKEGRLQVTLSAINKPNLDSISCDYQANTVSLQFALTETGELPNEVVYPFPPDTVSKTILDTVICSGWENDLKVRPSQIRAGYTYTWSDNSSDTVFTISKNGIYWVNYGDDCHFKVDTFKVKGGNLVPPVITVNIFELRTIADNYDSYQWMLNGQLLPGATQNTYTVLENGSYQVIVANKQGCVDTSEVYKVTNVNIQLPGDISALIEVWPNPVQEAVFVRAPMPVRLSLSNISGRLIQPQLATHFLSMQELAAGMYLLRIADEDGRLLKVEKLVKVK